MEKTELITALRKVEEELWLLCQEADKHNIRVSEFQQSWGGDKNGKIKLVITETFTY